MANALLGVPAELTLDNATGTQTRPALNALNDEPGLIAWDSDVTTGYANFDVSCNVPINDNGFLLILGLESTNFQVRLERFSSLADLQSNTNGTLVFLETNGFSSNSSNSKRKFFKTFSGTGMQHFAIRIRANSGTARLDPWRILLGNYIQPSDNIEIRAQSQIDDRQRRQFSPTGRRNFINTGVFPAFTGRWPWLSLTEYRENIRPLSLKRGASRPVVFVLDPDETSWGEDEIYYGDLEKDQSIVHDDGELYGYSFTIVDIAPVVPVD